MNKKTGKYAKWFLIFLLVATIVVDVYLDKNEEQQTISQWVLDVVREKPFLPFYVGIGIGFPLGHMLWPQKRKN